jgi:hypothetical protein
MWGSEGDFCSKSHEVSPLNSTIQPKHNLFLIDHGQDFSLASLLAFFVEGLLIAVRSSVSND